MPLGYIRTSKSLLKCSLFPQSTIVGTNLPICLQKELALLSDKEQFIAAA